MVRAHETAQVGGPMETKPQIRRLIAALTFASLLVVPELTLARHASGTAGTALSPAADAAAIVAGLFAGFSAASFIVHRLPHSRRIALIAALLSLAIGVLTITVANLAPPPFISRYPPPGTLTRNGVLNTLYLVATGVAIAATLRSACSFIQIRTQITNK